MKQLSLIIFVFCFSYSQKSEAQAPSIQWQHAFGGTSFDQVQSVIQTFDGGFAAVGIATSSNGDVTSNHGAGDVWVIKLDSMGTLQWQKAFGGSGDDGGFSIVQTSDSGFAIAASSTSSDGDVSFNHGATDWWILKLDFTGTLQWQKSFGGSIDDIPYSICPTSDHGFVISGYSVSTDGDVTGNHGFEDCWIIKLDSSGTLQWENTFGGSLDERAYAVEQTSDGGYIAGGYTKSNDGNVTGNHGDYDFWVIKLNSAGILEWQKSLGGSSIDQGHSIHQTLDGGFVIAGFTASSNGDVTLNNGFEDLWISKLDSLGILQWQKSLGGSGVDQAYQITQLHNGDYLIGGSSYSTNGDVTGNHGGYDNWVLETDSFGNIVWQKSLGGSSVEECYSISPTSDNGCILAGGSLSNDGDVTGNHGDFDFWIVKLTGIPASINTVQALENDLRVFPNPSLNQITIEYNLASHCYVSIEILNSSGQKIKTLLAATQDIGHYSYPISLDVSPGFYTIRIIEDRSVLHSKLIVGR